MPFKPSYKHLLGWLLLLFPVLIQAQVTATFSAVPLSGCSPLVVSFTDASTGPVTSWNWDFGNGNTSTLQNPGAVYVTPGQYTVRLIVSDGTNRDTIIRTNLITVFQDPTADFSGTPIAGCTPLTVNFSDQSTPGDGAITGWLWDFGDGTSSTLQNPSHTYGLPGSYTVTLVVTDANGCRSTRIRTNYINTANPPVAAFTGTPLNACNPPLTVTFNNTSSGGAPPLAYEWSFGDGGTASTQNPSHTYNSLGSFNVRLIVTDANGCSDTLTRNTYVNIAPVVAGFTPSATNICEGQAITFTDTSTGGANNWQWDFGDGGTSNAQNPTYTYNTAGTYTVTLIATSPAGCTDTLIIPNLITVDPQPTANFGADTLQSCAFPLTVNFTDSSTGAVAWAWNFGDGNTSTLQNPTHTYTAPGSYTVTLTVTGANGCTNTLVRNNYIVIQPPVANFNGVPQMGCAPMLVTFTDLSVSNEPIVTWQWDFGDGNTSNLQNPTHTYLNQGTYTVTLIIVNSAGCTDTLIRPNYIQVGIVPTASFTATPLTGCANDTIFFTDLSTNATTWFWEFGDGATSTAQNPQHMYQDTGCFNVRLTVTNMGCVDDTVINNLICIDPPIARFNLNPQIGCAIPHTVFFTDQSILPDTWLWRFGDGNTSTLQNPVHNYTATGNYQVWLIVRDTVSGCVDSVDANVSISIPVADFTATNLFGCGPLTVNFTDNSVGATAWNWDFGDGNTSNAQNPNHTYNNPGIYTVTLTVTDANGCTDTRTRTNFVQVIGPNVNFGADTLAGCRPLQVQFGDSTIFGAPITSWTWDFGDGNSSNLQNPSHLYDTTGNFSVSLTVTDNDGCTRTFTRNNYIFITDPTAAFTVVDSIGCQGYNFRFTNNSVGSGLSSLWDFGDGGTSTGNNPTHAYTVDSTYDISLIVTDVNGCMDTATAPASVIVTDPVANFGAAPLNASCPPLLVTFTDSSTYDVISWQWDFGDGTGSVLQNPSHVYATPGTFDVTLIITTAQGCTDTLFSPGLVNILGPTGTFVFDPDTGCTPQMVNFVATATNTVSYTWDFGDGTVAIGNDSITHTYTQTGVFRPIMILDDGLGCTFSVISPDTIVIDTIPFPDFSVSTNLLCGNDSVRFTDLTVSTRPVVSWRWDFGDGTTDTVQNPVHLYPGPGTYTVSLEVINTLGCTDSIVRNALITIINPPSAAYTAVPPVGCAPKPVAFTDNSTSSVPLIGWVWDFDDAGANSGAQNPTHTYVNTGSYNVDLIVIDSAGCRDTVTNIITVNPGPTANFRAIDSIGCPPFPVTFVADSGMGIVTWQWDFGDGNTGTGNPANHTYANAGNYTVTLIVTDTLGCTDTLVRPDYIGINPPVAWFTPDRTQGCPPLTVTFTDSTTSDTTLASFTWDFGDGNTGTGNPVTHTYANPGTYTVTLIVEDVIGCRDTAVRTNLITVFTPPTAYFGRSDTVGCVPLTVAFTDSSIAGSAPVTGWRYNFRDGNLSFLQNPIHTYNITGFMDVRFIATDANGCRDTIFRPLNVNPGPQANFRAVDSLGCPPFLVTFIADSGMGIANYSWDFGDGTTGTGNPVQHTYPNPGDYTVTLIVQDTIGCDDTLVKPNYIRIHPPTADFSPDITSGCPPLTVTFTDNSTGDTTLVNWFWDFGDGNTGTGQPVTHTYTTPGTYTVTLIVEDIIGCRDTLVRTNLITVLAPPTTAFNMSDTVGCFPLTVSFTDVSTAGSAPITNWNWDFGDGNSSTLQNPANTYLNVGAYNVTLITTDNNGCRDTLVRVLNVNPGPTANFNAIDSLGCPPFAVTFVADSGMGITTWNWDFGDGTTGTGNPAQHTYNNPGDYTVTLIVFDTLGCSDTLTKIDYIRIHPPIADFTANNTSGCPPLTVTFTDSSTFDTTLVNFFWDFGDGNSGTGNPVTYSYAVPDTYTVTLIVEDALGCRDTIVKPNYIQVYQPPTAAFAITDTVNCDPFTIELTDQSSGPYALTNWDWDFGDGTTSTLQNPVHPYPGPGPYTIQLIVTDANGCRDTATFPFVVPVRPRANFTGIDSLGCFPPLTTLFTADSNDVVSYFWTFGDGSTSNTGPVVSHTYTTKGYYTVSLVIEDIYGCFDTLVKPNNIFIDSLVAGFTLDNRIGCPPHPVSFMDTSYSDTTIVAWEWDFGDGNTSTLQNPNHVYTSSGQFTVTLVVTNAFGCTDTVTGLGPFVWDTIPPVAPPIYRVTVLNNNSTNITWQPYAGGADFGYYVIWRESPVGSGSFIRVDSLFRLTDTTYTDQGLNTRFNSYCYKIQVVDICGIGTRLNDMTTHCTVELTATPALNQAVLTWTPYQGWGSVAAYDVYRVQDYSNQNQVFLGTVPGSVTTFTDTAVVCYERYCYRIQAREAGGFNQVSWSDTSCATPAYQPNQLPMYMCSATILDDRDVFLTWNQPPIDNPMLYILEKSRNGGATWNTLATLPPNQFSYTDPNQDVKTTSYYYRISVLDSCGDISPLSNIARTIVLNAENQNGGFPSLQWNPYEDWTGGVLNYNVEIFDESFQQWRDITTVDGNTLLYDDVNTNLDQPFYCYRIRATESGGGCVSLSNTDCVPVGPKLFVPNAFTPNGDDVNDLFEIKGIFVADYNLQIYDRWGKMIFESRDLNYSWDGRFQNNDVQEGAYVWKITARGFDDTEIEMAGTVTLYR